MPNYFAYFMMFVWPLVAWRLSKKLPLEQAVIGLFLIPFLLLPEKTVIDLPGLPPFDKVTIPALVAFAIFQRRYKKQMKWLPESGIAKILTLFLFIFPILTFATNSDGLRYGTRLIPALTSADIISMFFHVATGFYIPFILAYNFLRTSESHQTIVKWIVVAGFIYTIPMLWEIRMSPQLHRQIYGFFPHSFGQQIRQNGFRPVVFLGHGLEVAMFFVIVTIGAVSLWKAKAPPLDKLGIPKLSYLGIVLVLCKTMGAVVYTAFSVPILLILGTRWRMRILCVLTIFVFSFPILRGEGYVPIDKMLEFFQGVDTERALSLKFRFDNEDLLLNKANERQYFGWGGWGRGRVYDQYTGRDLSITDGFWIIIFGEFGWFGYLTIFGLVCFPILSLYRKASGPLVGEVSAMTTCLATMLAFNLLDLIPNSSLTPITLLIAGAIQGWVAGARKVQAVAP